MVEINPVLREGDTSPCKSKLSSVLSKRLFGMEKHDCIVVITKFGRPNNSERSQAFLFAPVAVISGL
jgi:hypothetical protein